jgi:hypothetical protein
VPEPGSQIRATHPDSFRSGEWATLKGTALLPFNGEDRACYLVEFPDGITDFWAIGAAEYGYEFGAAPETR